MQRFRVSELSRLIPVNHYFQNFLLNKMANMVLPEVSSEIGWDRNFAIPLSNTENKALEDEVRKDLAESSVNIKV